MVDHIKWSKITQKERWAQILKVYKDTRYPQWKTTQNGLECKIL